MRIQPKKTLDIWGALQLIWNGLLYFLEDIVPVLSLVIVVFSLIVQIFYRYVLGTPLTWPFELSIYAYIWTLYLGAAHAVHTQDHVRLDIIYNQMPLKLQKLCDIGFNTVITVLFLLILRPAWDYLLFSYRIKTVGLKLPWTYVFGVFPLFLALVVVHNIGHIVRDTKIVLGRDGTR